MIYSAVQGQIKNLCQDRMGMDGLGNFTKDLCFARGSELLARYL